MELASAHARVSPPLDGAMLASAAKQAAAAAAECSEPTQAIDAAIGALHEAVGGLFPSVFVLEHGRLWLVSQRGYAVVPDGISMQQGVMGRAVRSGREQLAQDVRSDADYVGALPGVQSELAFPLRVGKDIVGAFNIESERVFPDRAPALLQSLAEALAPLADALRTGGKLDLSALARLFVHLGSLRDPGEIAALAAASLARVLPVDVSQVVMWNDVGAPVELAAWTAHDVDRKPLSAGELDAARALVDPMVVCQLIDTGRTKERGGRPCALVWLPLRANGMELGAIVAGTRQDTHVEPSHLDTAAVLAAHVAATLDAAVSLERERRSAATDPLTGILNRRGLEERLEGALAAAQERRTPLSLLVIDCDDFKDINDRAGHEFGDALLYEIAKVLVSAIPDGAEAARLGGDEFVVMLPGAGADSATGLATRIRSVLADGLTDAGYPLRISGGVSSYPFDGATPSGLLRAADQALYAAKNAGKDRVASFADISRPDPEALVSPDGVAAADGRKRGRGEGSVFADVVAASTAIDAETTTDGVCSRLCKSLVFVVGATACSASRVAGEFLVDATEHALREVSLGDEASYRISDFPLTAETLRKGEARAVSFLDGDVDPAEAFILRELGMNALLLLPLNVRGEVWGLVEVYEMRLRRFTEDDVAVARFLAAQAEHRLAVVGTTTTLRSSPPVYELPTDEARRTPRTR